MTAKSLFFRHVFGGGFASDFGENAEPELSDNVVVIPYLVDADNVIYSLDGGPHKAPGTTKLSSELEGGAEIKGLFDAWFSGTSGSSSQHRICHVGTKIKKDDGDGMFTDLFTGLETDKVPSYAMLEDLLVIASDSTADVPKSWDGSTAQNLAGSPQNFAILTEHKNRLWAAGVVTNPSRLYYCASLNPEDWTGSGSGFIDISPDDGDVITGLASHKNELWVFKGPYKGSIHRIINDSPADFARKTFITGLGAAGHNTIFKFKDDLGFMWADGSVHSLNATAAFGDFSEAALSRDIREWLVQNINFSQIKHFWAANNEQGGYILFSVAVNGATTNNYTLMMDYRFNPVRWALWPAFVSGSLICAVDPAANNKRILLAGGTDGFVRKYDQANRSIDGTTGISYKWTTPFINYGSSITTKTLSNMSLALVRKNDGTISFGWRRDNKEQQTISVSQAGYDVLGTASSNQFTLNTSTLAGGSITDVFNELEEGGEFRSIQYQAFDSANLNDVDIHAFSATIEAGSWSTEADL